MASLVGSGSYRAEPRLRVGRPFDAWLLLAALVLVTFGLICLYSQGSRGNEFYFKRQLLNVEIGLIPVAIFALTKPRFWMKSANLFYVINIIALLAVFKFGAHRNGAERWIELGPVQFQPSEMAKMLLVLTLSSFYAVRQDVIDRPSTFLLGLAHMILPAILVVKQPHVGGALVLGVIWLAVSIASNVPSKFLFIAGGVFVFGLGLVFAFPDKFPMIVHGYHARRTDAFLNSFGPSSSANQTAADRDIDYQTNRARVAFGVGGVVGAGFGKGEQGANIPEQQTDFIFTVPGEELGLIGCTLALAGFGFLFYRIWLVGLHATEPFYRMVVTGLLGMLAFHTFVNLFMVTQMLPVMGLWLPFLSYGGTAMWLCMSSIALILNIRSREKPILF